MASRATSRRSPAELTALGHDARILAPFDPDDALSRRLHRGARPQRLAAARAVRRARAHGRLCPRTAPSRTSPPLPHAVRRPAPRAARRRLRRRAHPRAGRAAGQLGRALLAPDGLPLVGTFHTYSENASPTGSRRSALGGAAADEPPARAHRRLRGRRLDRAALLRRALPDRPQRRAPRRRLPGRRRAGEGLQRGRDAPGLSRGRTARQLAGARAGESAPLRILFIGQAVERKGLPVLLRAFEALREHVPGDAHARRRLAPRRSRHMMLDDRGVQRAGQGLRDAQARRARARRRAVRAVPAWRELRHGPDRGVRRRARPWWPRTSPATATSCATGVDGLLMPPGDALALAEALRRSRSTPPAARGWRPRRASAPSASPGRTSPPRCSTATSRPSRSAARDAPDSGRGASRLRARRSAAAHPRPAPASQPPGGGAAEAARAPPRPLARARCAASRLPASLLGAGLARAARCSASASPASPLRLVASKPGLLLAGLGLMCWPMFVRALAWHAILAAAPTWRRAKRRDAMQGTFIGVLMSATLPARLGEPSRALIVARRLGRARETLPVVLGTMVSQTLLNLLALAILGLRDALQREPAGRSRSRPAADRARAARRLCSPSLLAPVLIPPRRGLTLARALQAALAGAARSAAAPARRPARLQTPPPSRARDRHASSARGRCSGCRAGCC